LFMTLPGLALFYGGLVRAENVLSVLMHCFSIACLVSVLWLLGAYSLVFNGTGSWIGNLDKALLLGIPRAAVATDTRIRDCVFHVPDDVRHHHARADCWCVCGADAFLRRAAVRRALAAARLCAGGPLGLGRRLAQSEGGAGFCWRTCGSSDRWSLGPGARNSAWASHRFSERCEAASCAVDDHGWRLHALGRLVRFQRRQRACSKWRCGHGHDSNAYLRCHGGACLADHRV